MNEETLFQEALSRSPEERAAFLEQACEGRPELRAAVEALLAAHEKSGNILDRPRSIRPRPWLPALARPVLTPPSTTLRGQTTHLPRSPGPPTTDRSPRPASSSPGATRSRRRSARAAWARSGSPSRPSRSSARSRSS